MKKGFRAVVGACVLSFGRLHGSALIVNVYAYLK
jgi:hypothetical protein